MTSPESVSDPRPPDVTGGLDSRLQTSRRRPRWLWAIVAVAFVLAGGAWVRAQIGSPRPGPFPPALSALTITPPNVVVGASTSVVFTVRVPTVLTIKPLTIDLQQIDSNGVVQSILGPMKDDGQSGDSKAGDRIFTLRAQIAEPSVGRIQFRAAGTFLGYVRSAESPTVAFDVDPFLLPPDPGEAGKQTLEGIDSDGDGVRDDVQRWIALTGLEADIRNTLTTMARVQQTFLANSEAEESVILQIVERRHAAQDCLKYLAGSIGEAADIRQRLRAVLLDTAERSEAYVRADARLSGVSFPPTDPASWSESCE